MQPLTWLSNTQRYPCQQIILEEVTMLLRVIRIPTSTSTEPVSSCRKVQEVEEETMLLRAIKTPTSASTKPVSSWRKAQEVEEETMLLRAIKTPTSTSKKPKSKWRQECQNQGEAQIAQPRQLETIYHLDSPYCAGGLMQ